MSAQPTGSSSRTHRAVVEPHWPPEVRGRTAARPLPAAPGRPGRSGRCRSRPCGCARPAAYWELSSRYCANCSKCQWLWPFFESNPIVPARARPMIFPFCQKYWYAFMIGEPLDRKPSTSSGALPPPTRWRRNRAGRTRDACFVFFGRGWPRCPRTGAGPGPAARWPADSADPARPGRTPAAGSSAGSGAVRGRGGQAAAARSLDHRHPDRGRGAGGRDAEQLRVGGRDGVGDRVMPETQPERGEVLLGRVHRPAFGHAPDQRLREGIADALLRVRGCGRAARGRPAPGRSCPGRTPGGATRPPGRGSSGPSLTKSRRPDGTFPTTLAGQGTCWVPPPGRWTTWVMVSGVA